MWQNRDGLSQAAVRELEVFLFICGSSYFLASRHRFCPVFTLPGIQTVLVLVGGGGGGGGGGEEGLYLVTNGVARWWQWHSSALHDTEPT